MRFEVGEQQYSVDFDHVILPRAEYDCAVHHCIRGATYAVLQTGQNGNRKVIADAFALCSASDNFCKETGRKLALRRLLDHTGWSREARRAVWQAYWRSKGVERG